MMPGRDEIAAALMSVKWPDGAPYIHMARTHVDKLADAVLALFDRAPDKCPECGHEGTVENVGTKRGVPHRGCHACGWVWPADRAPDTRASIVMRPMTAAEEAVEAEIDSWDALDRAPDTAPAEAADELRARIEALCVQYEFEDVTDEGEPFVTIAELRAALAAPPAPTTTDAAEGGETPISTWQARAGHWTDTRFPADTIKDRGLILGEEVGEVMRCIVKGAQNIRGGTDHWNAELRKESVDAFFGLVALAHRARFDLSRAIEEAWPAIDAKVFTQGPAAASSSPTADAACTGGLTCPAAKHIHGCYSESAAHQRWSRPSSSPVSDPAAEGCEVCGRPVLYGSRHVQCALGCTEAVDCPVAQHVHGCPAASPDPAAGEAR